VRLRACACVCVQVGLSGSGKSTCLRLLSRLCDADSGEVRLWERDVRAINRTVLRERISFVAQQPVLFDDTLRWNVVLGALDASDAAVAAAIEAAALGPSVALLPEGIETRVGERGGRLSGGERQRVAVARALLRDAPLLLADEPTAAADGITEAALVDALRSGTTHTGRVAGSGSTRTLLLVVHRLAAVCPSADHIVVFRDGRVVESGRHADLLGARGEYARLWRAQAVEVEAFDVDADHEG
jgi:ABC-type multidrug transport system fused ATPase/permease subunit